VARAFSSTAPTASYVVVDHSDAYENSMQGPHGKQLALARLEGAGKDDPTFDPFAGEFSSNSFEDDEIFEHDATMVEAGLDDDEDGDDEEEDDDELEGGSLYNPDGSLRRKKSVLATLRAGFPSGGQFAVIELGGAQFKVTTDDVIVANRLQPVSDYKIGSVHTLKEVMLVGSSHMTLVGMPFVVGAEVDIMVEEITRDAKVIVFKKRRRKNSQRKNGFRRDVSLLRVLDVRMPEEYRNHTHIGREIVDTLGEHFEQMPPLIPPAKMQSSTTI
jgi:large subunit ribosomal protein L21